MTTGVPELSRPLRVDRVPAAGCEELVEASAEERTLLARRLALPALHALAARLLIEPARGRGLRVHGTILARVTQTCVVTLEDFDTDMHVEVERYYVPATEFKDGDEDASDEDVELIRNGEVDLGELVSEALALAIDPYPRKPGVSFQPVTAIGEAPDDGRETPFAGLARLKDRPRRQ